MVIGTLYQYFPNRDAILIRLAYMIMDEEVSVKAHRRTKVYHHLLEKLMATRQHIFSDTGLGAPVMSKDAEDGIIC